MEEKLLQAIKSKIASLENSKKECETAIEEVSNERRIENGKLKNTNEMLEYRKDLEKIMKEIEDTELEKEDVNNLLKEKREKTRLITNEQQLLKEEEQCKKAIEEISKTKVFENGQLVKSKEQLEYESDLIKIQKELEVLQKEKINLEKINKMIQEKVKKYKLKEEKKLEKDTVEEEYFTGDVIDKDGKEISEQEEIKKEKEEREEEKNIEKDTVEVEHFTGDVIDKDRKEISEQEESKGETKENTEDIKNQEQSQKGTEEEQPNNEEVKDIKTLKIRIGKKAQIYFGDKVYNASRESIIEGIDLKFATDEELLEYIETKIKIADISSTAFKTACKQGLIDTTVVNAIYSTDMKENDKRLALKKYITTVIAAKNGELPKEKNKATIIYDMKELSKVNFIDRLLGKEAEMNEHDKVIMVDTARYAERWGIAKIEGNYKYSLKAKLLNFIKGTKLPKLPATMKDMQVVATRYDEIRYKSKYEKENGKTIRKSVRDADGKPIRRKEKNFRGDLHCELEEDNRKSIFNREGLTKSQQEELESLAREQEEQER